LKEVQPSQQHPYFAPMPYYPQPYTNKNYNKSKDIIFALIIIFLIIAAVIVGSIFFISPDPSDRTDRYYFDVLVAQDGHYKYALT
jgi:type IV secretory pathway component VirB8